MRDSFIESSAYVQDAVNNGANWREDIRTKSGIVDGSVTERMSQFLKVPSSNFRVQRNSVNRSVPSTAIYGDLSRYRQPDGSYNNLLLPDLGGADTPYARVGKPQGIQNVALPDPGDVFDMLFARSEQKSHPNKLSSLFFSMATVISHDLFQTNPHNPEYSQTSHYADLSPLYGNNWEEQQQMRTYLDGRLKPDCFASKRILSLHPSAGVLLIMFNRFHNYVISQLLAINENGRFTKPNSNASAEAWQKYDEGLFQTARLIVCAYYVNVIIQDYMRTILGWDRTGGGFNVDPRDTKELETATATDSNSANGNLVTVEFNLTYRWHGGISAANETWVEEHYKTIFGKETRDIETEELVQGLQSLENGLELDPSQREFSGLVRDQDGTYDDDTLVSMVTAAVEDVSNSLGPNTVPKALRAMEIQGIAQARKWNVCALNEFRECLQLKKYTTFEEINPDRRVARKLKALYGYPDLVELYPGLVAEKLRSQREPGQGLYCGSTTARALLSSTITLIGGDRFCTADYTPSNLTNWGYAFSRGDPTVDQGHIIYKLFLTVFPNHFEHNSIYAHFPFTIPSEKRNTLLQLGKEEYYSYNRPRIKPDPITITGYWSATDLLSDNKCFRSSLGDVVLKTQTSEDQVPSTGSEPASTPALLPSNGLYDESLSQGRVSRFIQETAQNLIDQNSVQIMKEKQVDIIRNVTNITVTHFVSDLFGIPRSRYPLRELHRILTMASFNSPYSTPEMFEASAALPLLGQVASSLIAQVKEISRPRSMILFQKGSKCKSSLMDLHSLRSQGQKMIRLCLNNNMSESDIVWKQILPVASGLVTEVSTAFALVLDYYLSNGEEYLQRISKAATVETAQSDEVLFRYILEAMRINARLPVIRTSTMAGIIRDGEREHIIDQGNTIVIDTVSASIDPNVFPEPTEVRLDRPMDTYLHFTKKWFSGSIVSARTVQTVMISLFRTVMKLNELKPARGVQGQLKKLDTRYGYYEYLNPDWSIKSHFPTTFTVRYITKVPTILQNTTENSRNSSAIILDTPSHILSFQPHPNSQISTTSYDPLLYSSTAAPRTSSDSDSYYDDYDEKEVEWKGGLRVNLIVLTLSILSMTTALDAGILVTSLPTIATAEHSSESSGFWIGTSYLLVAAVLMPFIGALSDILGRRPVFATTVLSLMIGSIVAGSAQSTAQIIVGRVLQGIGPAGVQPLTYVLLTDLVPLRQRPKYLAFVHLSFAVGLAVASLIGGVLSQYSTWRWVFYINLPFCAIGLVMIFFFMNLEQKNHASLFQKPRTQVDWAGSFIFTTSITLTLVALTWGGVNFSWSSPATLVPLIFGILGLFATWPWEKRHATNPFIRLAIFKEWSAIAGYIATVIFGLVVSTCQNTVMCPIPVIPFGCTPTIHCELFHKKKYSYST